jgi:hypothetical protein
MASFIPLLPLQVGRYIQTNCQSYRRSSKMTHTDKVVNVDIVEQQERERERERKKEKNAIG